MKNETIQFKTIKEIERFLNKAGSGTLDNAWENITDEYDRFNEPELCVKEFNKAVKCFKKLVSLRRKKDFDVVVWDWKEECPWRDLVKFSKKYKHTYETNLNSDTNFVFFSDFKIKSDDEAEALWMS